MCDDEQAWIPEGSEFQTERTAKLKLLEAKVLQTQGTDNSLMFEKQQCSMG